jgi:hypothetical protein
MLVFTASLTLFGKYFWDRYLTQEARTSRREFDAAIKALREECALRRSSCQLEAQAGKVYMEGLIKQQAGCLEDAFEGEERIEKRRSQTRRSLLCIMMTQLKICEALNSSGLLGPSSKLDCSDISKMMVEMGVIE